MTTAYSVNSAIDNLPSLVGRDVAIEGVLCFDFEGTAINHFPKAEQREPGPGSCYPSSVWLSVCNGALRFNEEQLKQWVGKRVTVLGTLYAPSPGFGGCGHMSLWPAEILARSIERL